MKASYCYNVSFSVDCCFMTHYLTLLLLVLTAFFAQLSYGVPVPGLYSATVVTEDRSKQSFTKASELAFIKVLVKTSGQSEALISSEPRIAQDIRNATKMVKRFSYQNQQNEQGEPELMITVSFADNLVNDVLRRGGLNIWPNNRPLTLVLPVVQQNNNKFLVATGQKSGAELAERLKHYSLEFGLPISFAKSAHRSQLEQLWSFKRQAIEQVGQTVRNDNSFVARVAIVSSGSYIGSWFLTEKDKHYSLDVSATNADEFVEKGFAWLAKHYSNQFSLALVSNLNEHQLSLSGINSMQDYDNAISYLQNHDLIDHVYLLEVNGDTLFFSMSLKSNVDQLQKSFELDRKLAQQIDADADLNAAHSAMMRYSWR
jgi:hypothetical protein